MSFLELAENSEVGTLKKLVDYFLFCYISIHINPFHLLNCSYVVTCKGTHAYTVYIRLLCRAVLDNNNMFKLETFVSFCFFLCLYVIYNIL